MLVSLIASTLLLRERRYYYLMPYLDPQRDIIGSPKYLQQIVYSFEIYPFADSARTKTIIITNYIAPTVATPSAASALTTPIIGSTTTTSVPPNYILESFSFSNDIFNPIQTGTCKVAQQSYTAITLFQDIAEGDLLFIKENGNTIFTGYIESLQLDITSEGTALNIGFVNILKQLSMGKVFGNIINQLQPAQGIEFGTLISTITANTLLSYAENTSFLQVNILKGQGENPNVVLTASNTVYVSISSYMTILQVLNKILFPYQRFIYQDSLGNVNIAPLSLFNSTLWYFTQSNTPGLGMPYTNMTIKKNAAAINNFEYATLFSIPIAQGVLAGNQSQANSSFFAQFSPPVNYYTRLNQLYNSKIFQITDVIIEDLISDPSKIDETLNHISDLVQSASSTGPASAAAITISALNQTPQQQKAIPSSGGPADVSSILFNYAARAMAENIISETEVYITTPRVTHTAGTTDLLPIPLNQLISVSLDPGIIETTTLFCRGYVLTYSNTGTLVTLNLCKPLAGCAYWVNGELVNA
jgi:hypothetical protein